MLWAGRVASAIPVLLILFGSIVKLLQLPSVIDGFRQSGFQPSAVLPVGIIELVCTVVYLIPRTRFLGAVLMTGLLGGAVATNVRMEDPTWILPALCGVLVWAGLFFRDERLRALIPVRA
jgi:hypothetical protein